MRITFPLKLNPNYLHQIRKYISWFSRDLSELGCVTRNKSFQHFMFLFDSIPALWGHSAGLRAANQSWSLGESPDGLCGPAGRPPIPQPSKCRLPIAQNWAGKSLLAACHLQVTRPFQAVTLQRRSFEGWVDNVCHRQRRDMTFEMPNYQTNRGRETSVELQEQMSNAQ